MHWEESDDMSVSRLEGLNETKGGLIVKKKPSSTASTPRQSLLGLDKLAAAKAKEDAEKVAAKHKDKHYRIHEEETPGRGVSDSVRANIASYIEEKMRREKHGLFAATTKDRKRSRHDSDSDEDDGKKFEKDCMRKRNFRKKD